MEKKKLHFPLKYYLWGIFIGLIAFGGTLLYSRNFELIGFIDASTMAMFITFTVGWFMLISNEGTLDILYYGVAAFGKALVGKRMKNSYLEYTTQKDKLPRSYFIGFWFASLTFLIVFFILYNLKK
jgi:hypothetical protein